MEKVLRNLQNKKTKFIIFYFLQKSEGIAQEHEIKLNGEKKMEESDKCGNCGHRRDWHFIGRDNEMKCRIPKPECNCKEFKEE